jgi:hypothetical protein
LDDLELSAVVSLINKKKINLHIINITLKETSAHSD